MAFTLGYGSKRRSNAKGRKSIVGSGTKSASYTDAEIDDFNEKLGPGAGVALQSLRKNHGIRIEVEPRNK